MRTERNAILWGSMRGFLTEKKKSCCQTEKTSPTARHSPLQSTTAMKPSSGADAPSSPPAFSGTARRSGRCRHWRQRPQRFRDAGAGALRCKVIRCLLLHPRHRRRNSVAPITEGSRIAPAAGAPQPPDVPAVGAPQPLPRALRKPVERALLRSVTR